MYPFKKFSLGELKGVSGSTHKPVGDPILYRLITRRYCEFLQRHIPASVTPNTITWIGLLSVAASFLLTVALDWTLKSPPRYLHLVNGISVLVYLTTDSLDGIHARKSNQCSAIGKILDHFVDSNNVFFCLVMLCSTLKVGHSQVFASLFLCVLSGFYVAAIVERHTGYLKFSAISGASEGLYMAALIHVLAFIRPDCLSRYLDAPRALGRANTLFATLAVVYLAYIFVDMAHEFRKNRAIVNPKQAMLSVARYIVLVLLFAPFFVLKARPFYSSLAFLVIFSQAYSVCYLEEYVSSMTKLHPNGRVFIISYTILILKGIHFSLSNSSYTNTLLLIMSSLHFFLRSGSVLRGLSHQLRVKLFTSKF